MSYKYRIFGKNLYNINDVLLANGIGNKRQLQWYNKFKRFGIKDPYNGLTDSKEYLFFTKPDLNIVKRGSSDLNPELANQPYFIELRERYPDVIAQLQYSNGIGDQGPFMALLSNSVKNALDLPAINSSVIETPSTIYGTSYNYRGWGYESDEKLSFSLEFEDSKYLEIYNLVKAYEEYERLKHLGLVTPHIDYIMNKILHDQFSIYKFIVDADGETIIYYAKLWGVFFKNVPRDVFSEMADGTISYSIEFDAAFVDDMNPSILADFNVLTYPYIRTTTNMPIYNETTRMIDGSWATMPVITKIDTTNLNGNQWNGPKKMKHIYKLKWRK